MITVAQYRAFAVQCRDMAARMSDPSDRRALELQASAWDKIANEREAAIEKGKISKSP
ncbi:MAG TPA: hypothetical protein VMA30_20090 [Xanthobacteraceae bacterium]|nr:hypothetical protein [Xanthobacteraceae bacterium]